MRTEAAGRPTGGSFRFAEADADADADADAGADAEAVADADADADAEAVADADAGADADADAEAEAEAGADAVVDAVPEAPGRTATNAIAPPITAIASTGKSSDRFGASAGAATAGAAFGLTLTIFGGASDDDAPAVALANGSSAATSSAIDA